jgi:hypothetical protein
MLRPLADESPERPQLITLHRMRGGRAILGPPDVQEACLEVDLIPLIRVASRNFLTICLMRILTF